MKGLMALYLILFLISDGCMMAPMALLPALQEKLQPRQEAPPTLRREQGQVAGQQNPGGQNSSRAHEAVRPGTGAL
ncbi:MAG: hypothetical protein ACYDIC_14535 [Desulfobaccales bacterium]